MISSILTRIETERTVRRQNPPAGFEARLSVALDRLEQMPIDEPVVQRAGRLGPPALRSLDAIHLASALMLADELEGIVTYDARLAQAAELLGIPVFSPAGDN